MENIKLNIKGGGKVYQITEFPSTKHYFTHDVWLDENRFYFMGFHPDNKISREKIQNQNRNDSFYPEIHMQWYLYDLKDQSSTQITDLPHMQKFSLCLSKDKKLATFTAKNIIYLAKIAKDGEFVDCQKIVKFGGNVKLTDIPSFSLDSKYLYFIVGDKDCTFTELLRLNLKKKSLKALHRPPKKFWICHTLCNPEKPHTLTIARIKIKKPWKFKECKHRIWLIKDESLHDYDMRVKTYPLTIRKGLGKKSKHGGLFASGKVGWKANKVDIQSLYKNHFRERITHESWFWDGQNILFVSRPDKLKILNIKTKKDTTVAEGAAFWHAGASFQGDKIIADTGVSEKFRDGLWLIHLNSAKEKNHIHQRIQKVCKTTLNPNYQEAHPHPSFSPDGKLVLFNSIISGDTYIHSVRIR